jgi:hypothetical protein
MGVEAGRRQETGRQGDGGGNAVSTVGSAFRGGCDDRDQSLLLVSFLRPQITFSGSGEIPGTGGLF